jgi:hydroxymethylbilane synthase
VAKVIRIGTRESQLAVWQANQVKQLLEQHGYAVELIFIKSEGDVDLTTPLYEIGVQGVFTRALDIALLEGKIDVAVHSMKDVPTRMAKGLTEAAVLPRANHKDLLVMKDGISWLEIVSSNAVIATSSIRRKAQWLHRFPNHIIENLRGNVNTRLQKLKDNNWHGAIFAAAGVERIGLRPENSIELDWIMPAPAQGAIVVVCREQDDFIISACLHFNDAHTALCTHIERDFLRVLMGGCSTPISGYACRKGDEIVFEGNILSLDGSEKAEVKKIASVDSASDLGVLAATELMTGKGKRISEEIKKAGKNGVHIVN